MIRENRFLVFDTETQGVENKLVYDLGYFIVNRRGRIFESRRFLVREIITDPEIMCDAFYHSKVYTNYIPMIDKSENPMLASWEDIALTMRSDMQKHNVNILTAYNLLFDLSAMRATSQHIGYSGHILTSRPTLLDLWLFACQHLFTRPTYKTMADREGWKSEAGNYRTTAEHAFRYLTLDYNYAEPHTALEDAEIEAEILFRLLAMRKRIPYNELIPNPWRIPQDDK
jgi:hypothetical protein